MGWCPVRSVLFSLLQHHKFGCLYFVVIFVLELMILNESSLTAPVYAKVCKKRWSNEPTVIGALLDKSFSTD